MNARKSVYAVLLNVLLLAAIISTGCAPVATPTAAPTEVSPAAEAAPIESAFDIEAVVRDYITNQPDGFSSISAEKLNEQMAATDVFLLDVREAKELADNGFIEDAVNIPLRSLTQSLDKLPAKDQPIVVYCAVGHRGAIGMVALQLLGYTNVKSLASGFKAWTAAGLPVANGTPAEPAAGQAPEIDKDLFAAIDQYITNLPDGFTGISAEKLNEQMAATDVFLLDVREEKEISDNGAIEGAVNVPLRATFTDIAKLPQDKSTPIVVYCAIGHRGAMGMVALQLAGYTNVKSLSNGYKAWVAAELPVTQ